jgi:hypothetical protein
MPTMTMSPLTVPDRSGHRLDRARPMAEVKHDTMRFMQALNEAPQSGPMTRSIEPVPAPRRERQVPGAK